MLPMQIESDRESLRRGSELPRLDGTAMGLGLRARCARVSRQRRVVLASVAALGAAVGLIWWMSTTDIAADDMNRMGDAGSNGAHSNPAGVTSGRLNLGGFGGTYRGIQVAATDSNSTIRAMVSMDGAPLFGYATRTVQRMQYVTDVTLRQLGEVPRTHLTAASLRLDDFAPHGVAAPDASYALWVDAAVSNVRVASTVPQVEFLDGPEFMAESMDHDPNAARTAELTNKFTAALMEGGPGPVLLHPYSGDLVFSSPSPALDAKFEVAVMVLQTNLTAELYRSLLNQSIAESNPSMPCNLPTAAMVDQLADMTSSSMESLRRLSNATVDESLRGIILHLSVFPPAGSVLGTQYNRSVHGPTSTQDLRFLLSEIEPIASLNDHRSARRRTRQNVKSGDHASSLRSYALDLEAFLLEGRESGSSSSSPSSSLPSSSSSSARVLHLPPSITKNEQDFWLPELGMVNGCESVSSTLDSEVVHSDVSYTSTVDGLSDLPFNPLDAFPDSVQLVNFSIHGVEQGAGATHFGVQSSVPLLSALAGDNVVTMTMGLQMAVNPTGPGGSSARTRAMADAASSDASSSDASLSMSLVDQFRARLRALVPHGHPLARRSLASASSSAFGASADWTGIRRARAPLLDLFVEGAEEGLRVLELAADRHGRGVSRRAQEDGSPSSPAPQVMTATLEVTSTVSVLQGNCGRLGKLTPNTA